ncbi:P-loop containing nucleoside triphosphate hydrolase protein [Emericellopsis atlantica]|uniref:P-loop containing nucleoside triphosphate hydrolase protein n=1 Tax=Emericellopsis atlantica TaxID=2614577 RepID=A0A9P7ZPZ5_9HYPO|nr:P-loop containing nucleoside triphosphate hydrolase protein [Emericellopsis atlantica]KAG9255956.1 P-loop containing nucleoside triphosphate hydrolase protein [Emericellopsis atlantica]
MIGNYGKRQIMVSAEHMALLPVSATGFGLTCLFTVPAIVAIVRQTRKGAPKDQFYEDEDGKSTPEAIANFSNRVPKAVILFFSAVGLGTSTGVSVLTSLNPARDGLFYENWLVSASWGLIALQAMMTWAIHAPVEVHDLGVWTFGSALVTLITAVLQAFDVGDHLSRKSDVALALRIVNVVAALATVFGSISIPRRPEVFFRDQPVDAQWTTTVLSRYTWTWARQIIDLASKKGDLEEKDVPQPDHTIRVDAVMSKWNSHGYTGELIWSIIHCYRWRFALQWSVTIFRCVLGIGPFWAMLQLINLLQERGGGGSPSRLLWGLVILLGVFSLSGQWIDGWVNYYSIAMISQPLRAQLSALIYEKSLRRKNVKAADKPKESPEPKETDVPQLVVGEEPEELSDAVPVAESTEEPPSSPDQTGVLKSRQAIVNLVGVDTRRIADFCSIQFLIVSSLGKLVVYSGFLIELLGWIPFIVGMAAWAIVLPFNTYFAKRYVRLSEVLMHVRDDKLAVLNEALLGMRQIKFAALEKQWEKRIMDMRDKELAVTWSMFLGDVVIFGCWLVSPIFLAAAALASYSLLNGGLTPSVAFVSISIFNSLETTLGALPEILTVGFDTLVSVRRVGEYLKGPEMSKIVSEGPLVAFENATIAWPVDDEVVEEDRFLLRDLNFSFPAGELSVVSGKTGTGKSLILSALIGEVDLIEGKVTVPPTVAPAERHDENAHPGNWILPGSMAYVAQTPWLESASLRDNILFGLPFVESRYNLVLDVCALKKDLEILTDGDKTELGANGINLSGGQKWRISLARAIYSRAEILIMDDIFSAVDAHVGREIFDKCIGGAICEGRTRILVTHHVGLVQSLTKFLVELGEGCVLHAGLTSDLEEEGILERIKSHEQKGSHQEDPTAGSSAAVSSETSITEIPDDDGEVDGKPAQKDNAADEVAKKFIQDETRETGTVKTHVYLTYMRDCSGWFLWVVWALIYIAFEAGNVGRGWWVRIWTGGQGKQHQQAATNVHQEHGHAYGFALQQSMFHAHSGPFVADANGDLGFYLSIYIALSLGAGLIGTLRFFWGFVLSIRGSRVLFSKILHTVIRTPLRWLDTVPVGRILNRLTSDFDIIDQRLTMDLGFFFWHILSLGGVCVAAALVSPYILPLAAVLIVLAGVIGKKYLDGARPLKRLESTSKSPVFELFNATLSGISTLRGFQKTDVYIDRMYRGLDIWDAVSLYKWNVNRWVGFRMAVVGTVFTTTVGIVVIVSPQVDAAMAGFTLSFALGFSANMLMAIRTYSSLELNMNAAERVIEYCQLETEPQGGQEPPAAWPTSGRVEIDKLVVGYAADLPPVLKGLSFSVKNNERVGVIGRTGAGKSSLTLAIFRFLEARSGTVTIDGLDISKINLHALRSRLAIIPQDPVLFSGTIRSNLDPFNDRTDSELREALARVHLVDSAVPTPANEPASAAASTLGPQNTNVFRDLSSAVSESGGNLSQGQRQLLCLARAIVSRPKIMVLDEATSAVDMKTDALIQRSIREEFTGSTLIVIAHRLSTIADFDRILVLKDGVAAEFGTPKELWEQEGGSIFKDMCEQSGEKEKLRQTIYGEI